jgi:signal transduction histidine kinase/ligand-binding sensor domain-containing protein/CheY-like chemotaxis protein
MRNRILFLLLLLPAILTHAQEMKYLSVDEGLSSMIVRGITQDSRGVMWIATHRGVQSYNGTSFKLYEIYSMITKKGITDNRFLGIFYDGNKRLWTYNRNQVFIYNAAIDNFEEVCTLPDQKGAYSEILELHVTGANRLYIVTTGQFYTYDLTGRHLESICKGMSVNSMLQTDSETGLVATSKGLLVLNIKTNNRIPASPRFGILARSLGTSVVRSLKQDGFGNIWAITISDGVYILTPKNSVTRPSWNKLSIFNRILDLTTYKKQLAVALHGYGLILCNDRFGIEKLITADDSPQGLSNNGIQNFYVDREGRLWIATFGGGINYLDPNILPFISITHRINDNNSLANNMVRAICEDSRGNIWFGSKNGVSVWSRNTATWKHLNRQTDSGFNTDYILSIIEDVSGDMWISTIAGGITVCDKQLHIIKTFTTTNSELTSDDVFTLYRDTKNNIWISGEDGTLSCYLSKENRFRHYRVNSRVRRIIESRNGNIIVSGSNGVQQIDVARNRVEPLFIPKNQDNYIMVYSVLEDNRNNLWFATEGQGIYCLNSRNRFLTHYDISNGLLSNVYYGLLKDNKGNVWMSSQAGLDCIDPSTHKILNFSSGNGGSTLLREFIYGSYDALANGSLIFGGLRGAVMFDPAKVMSQPNIHPLIFTDFKIFNHSVIPGEKHSPLKTCIDKASEIVLKHNQNSFSIDFAAIDITRSVQNRYSWILEGLEKEWNTSTSMTTAYYTNISPGTYLFKVRNTSDTNAGKYNERVSRVVVLPPWWLSFWAYCVYALLLMMIVYIGITYFRDRLIANQAKEKINFFVSIAHDIKTPLSLIHLPLTTLKNLGTLDDKAEHELDIALKNTERLKTLFNQLLHFEKAADGSASLRVGKYRVEATILSIAKAFDPVIQSKKIHFETDMSEVTTWLWFDMDKFEKIMYNLLDNAFKYTDEGGSVSVSTRTEGTNYRIQINDSGIGISESQQSNIFRRYFRATNAVNSEKPGSGIGLLLVKELVKLHGGNISFSSKEGKGTTFTLTFPLGKTHYAYDTGVDYPASGVTSDTLAAIALDSKSQHKDTVLIVEDNNELMGYLKNNLEMYYQVTMAKNGVEALNVIGTRAPDIIITDYMMPLMNGIELCRQVKQNPDWMHIPVIILTALSSDQHKIEGFNAGADSYLEKPFDINVLLSRLNNLLAIRTMNKRAGTSDDIEPEAGYEHEFLRQFDTLVTEHIADSEFTVEDVCAGLGVSYSVLYRKIKDLSGITPNEFIVKARMEKARELLRTGKYNISEVAYMTGFTLPNYFSKVFKRHFNCAPNQLLKK